MKRICPALAALSLLLGAYPALAIPPEGTVEIVHAGPHTSGPNCWNGALTEAHVLHHRRFLTDKEFVYLTEHACTERQTSPQSGDLGRIWIPATKEELHGFLWLAPNLVFAKNSDQAEEQYVTMTYASMWSYYWTKRECKIDKEIQNTPECKTEVKYYSCQAPTGALAAQIERMQPINELVERLAFAPETDHIFRETCTSPSYLERNRILVRLQDLFHQLGEERAADPAYLALWLESIDAQVYETEVSTRSYNCKEQLSYLDKYSEYRKLREITAKLEARLAGDK